MAQEPNPRVFFDVQVGAAGPRGRIVMELFASQCPLTADNFRALCTGERGVSERGVRLSYVGAPFHRCIPQFMVQGGDIEHGNGTGGESIYGRTMPCEPAGLRIPHDRPMLLSMANRGRDTGSSQFFILTEPAPHLDGKHVVFGQVVHGEDVVRSIELSPVDDDDCPVDPVTIVHCGELELVRKPAKDKKKKSSSKKSSKSKKSKKAKRKRSRRDSGSDSGSASSSSDSSDSDADNRRRSRSSRRRRRDRSSSRSRSRSPSPARDAPAPAASVTKDIYTRLFGDGDRRMPRKPLMDPVAVRRAAARPADDEEGGLDADAAAASAPVRRDAEGRWVVPPPAPPVAPASSTPRLAATLAPPVQIAVALAVPATLAPGVAVPLAAARASRVTVSLAGSTPPLAVSVPVAARAPQVAFAFAARAPQVAVAVALSVCVAATPGSFEIRIAQPGPSPFRGSAVDRVALAPPEPQSDE
ncbi:hypothetical protein H9P43_006369 [Blastocladiella emersonii ATCC 22665]|nr:hypothetical protein H9P43_006369 [Blastocladiella emersonii ATCC 22665]